MVFPTAHVRPEVCQMYWRDCAQVLVHVPVEEQAPWKASKHHQKGKDLEKFGGWLRDYCCHNVYHSYHVIVLWWCHNVGHLVRSLLFMLFGDADEIVSYVFTGVMIQQWFLRWLHHGWSSSGTITACVQACLCLSWDQSTRLTKKRRLLVPH